MIKKCVVCGAEFKSSPSDKKITCSRKCLSIRRSQVLKNHPVSADARKAIGIKAAARGFTDNLQKGTPAAKNSEKGGRNEKNSSAKSYIIISPEDKEYAVTNLKHWIRNHIDLFDCELTDDNVSRIAAGFYTVKRNIKAQRSGQSYKGWTILDWDDRKNIEKIRNKD